MGVTPFFRLITAADKEESLASTIADLLQGAPNEAVMIVDPSSFQAVPYTPFAYWVGEAIREVFRRQPALGDLYAVDMGMSTKNDTRFVRLRWEVSTSSIGWDRDYRFYAKGGSSASELLAIDTVVWAEDDYRDLKADLSQKYPYLLGNTDWVLHPEYHYGEPGLTFGRRVRRFRVVPLPSDTVFSDSNPSIFAETVDDLAWLAAYLSSNIIRSLLGLMAPPRKIEVGYVQHLPVPKYLPPDLRQLLAALTERQILRAQGVASYDETDVRFRCPPNVSKAPINPDVPTQVSEVEADPLVAQALHLTSEDVESLLRE